jgi:hypothetical protein
MKVQYKKGVPTHCRKGHELSEENRYFKATGQICCMACDRLRYAANSETILERQRQRRLRNLQHCRSLGRNAGRKRRMQAYHLTEDKYAEMYREQRGLCILPSCGKPIEVIDHCHVTEQTRGLMCDNHNKALGLFSDNPNLLREAATYLEKFNGQQQLHPAKSL